MPTQPQSYTALLDRYYTLHRLRDIEAFTIPTNRQNHTRWLQAARRTRQVERHILRINDYLSGSVN